MAKHATLEHKLNIMRSLDLNDGSISKTAKDNSISRQSIYKFKDEIVGDKNGNEITIWELYLQKKNELSEKSLSIEAKKLEINENLNNTLKSIDEVFTLSLNTAKTIVTGILLKEKPTKVDFKDLVQLINVLAPYRAEKKNGIGNVPPGTTINAQHNIFVQEIVNKINDNGKRIEEDTDYD